MAAKAPEVRRSQRPSGCFATRNALAVLADLRRVEAAGMPLELLEPMVLDGVAKHQFMTDWVHYAVRQYAGDYMGGHVWPAWRSTA